MTKYFRVNQYASDMAVMKVMTAAKSALLADRWSDISPAEGTEECICSLCGNMIGTCDEDPRREKHDDEYCVGCEVCELAVRMWNGANQELRFHPKCFSEMTVFEKERDKK